MKKKIWILIWLFCWIGTAHAANFKIAVFDFDNRLDEPNTTAKYIEKQLRKKIGDIDLVQYSGKENEEHSIKVLKNLDEQHLDLIITITTDALIIASHVVKKTPTLFTNVNNPLWLGFRSLGPPGGNISGASYYVSVEKQLALYKKIMPELQRIGFIFDLNNKSKKVELPEARAACQKMHLEYGIEAVASESELSSAALNLIEDGAQAIAIGSSGMLYNHISSFRRICNDALVPIFSFNKNGTRQGALAALSSDYDRMADQLLIPMAVSVLKEGKSPGAFPIAFLAENRIFINLAQAEILGLKIPESILDKAVIIRQ